MFASSHFPMMFGVRTLDALLDTELKREPRSIELLQSLFFVGHNDGKRIQGGIEQPPGVLPFPLPFTMLMSARHSEVLTTH
jgi:hypothetical protein